MVRALPPAASQSSCGVDRPGLGLRQARHAGDDVRALRVVADEGGPPDPPYPAVVAGGQGIAAGLAGHGDDERISRHDRSRDVP